MNSKEASRGHKRSFCDTIRPFADLIEAYDDNNNDDTSQPDFKMPRTPPLFQRPAHSLMDERLGAQEFPVNGEDVINVFHKEDVEELRRKNYGVSVPISSYIDSSLSSLAVPIPGISDHEPKLYRPQMHIEDPLTLFDTLCANPNLYDREMLQLEHMHGLKDFLIDNFAEFSRAARSQGNAIDLLKQLTFFNCQSVESQRIANILMKALLSPYSSVAKNQPLEKQHKLDVASVTSIKDIMWAVCIAFYILRCPTAANMIDIPSEDETAFSDLCADLLVGKSAGNAQHLKLYWWTMRNVNLVFGGGRNKDFLVELVTRITRGRNVALSSNTAGGGLKELYGDNKVSIEKCRREIYVRVTGKAPVVRPNKGKVSVASKESKEEEATLIDIFKVNANGPTL